MEKITSWTEEEDAKLEKFYANSGHVFLTQLLSPRTRNAVYHRAKRLKIKKTAEYTQQRLDKIFVDRIERNKIESFDEMTQEKAYWLGFIYADGYINKRNNNLKIVLAAQDREHLKKIENILPNPSIYIRKDKKNIGYSWGSTYLMNRLNELGVFNKKSLDLKFPKMLSEEFYKSFILGYFDGDGTIYLVEKYFRCGFGMCGTKEFLSEVQKIILQYTGVELNIYAHGIIFNLTTKDRYKIIQVMKWLYDGSGVFLERKKEKFERLQFISSQDNTFGKHVIADFAECDCDFLDDIDFIQTHMTIACQKSNATIVSQEFHKFSPVGISGAMILAESNLCVHIWKDEKYVALDIFMCGKNAEPREAVNYLRTVFHPRKERIQFIKRGSHWAWNVGRKIIEKYTETGDNGLARNP